MDRREIEEEKVEGQLTMTAASSNDQNPTLCLQMLESDSLRGADEL